MKVCEYLRSRSFLYHIFFQVLYVLSFTKPRYQVSVYRAIGPLVFSSEHNALFRKDLQMLLAVNEGLHIMH